MGWSLVSTGCHGYMYFYYYRTYDKAVTRSGGGKVVTGCHGLPRVFGLWMCAGCHGLSRSRLCAGSEGPPLITPVMICDDVLVVVNFFCCVKRKCSGLTGHISEAGNTVITPLFFHHPWSGVGKHTWLEISTKFTAWYQTRNLAIFLRVQIRKNSRSN